MPSDNLTLRTLFLNFAHFLDHLVMLIYATAVISIALEFGKTYGEILVFATPGFLLFGAMALPFGWLGDHWGRHRLLLIFFIGIGISSILTGVGQNTWQIGGGLAAIGLFAAIYHPVGIPMLVQGLEKPGRVLGVNGVFGNLGVAAAPLFVGALAVTLGWRAAFIVPGILSIILGILFWRLVKPDVPIKSQSKKQRTMDQAFMPGWRHVLGVIAVVTLMGGLIFNSTTVSIPKLFEERLGDIGPDFLGFTAMAAIVYAVASLAQVIAGIAVDKFSAKVLITGLVTSQCIVFLLVSISDGYQLFALALLGMSFVFGQIPVIDTLITRYVPDSHRGKVFSIRYLLNLGVGALAVPMISYLHLWGGGFTALFQILGTGAIIMAIAAITLPRAVKTA